MAVDNDEGEVCEPPIQRRHLSLAFEVQPKQHSRHNGVAQGSAASGRVVSVVQSVEGTIRLIQDATASHFDLTRADSEVLFEGRQSFAGVHIASHRIFRGTSFCSTSGG